MGHGYWILIADGFGDGLCLINARMYTEGLDSQGNPKNWFPCEERPSEIDPIAKHGLENQPFARVIW